MRKIAVLRVGDACPNCRGKLLEDPLDIDIVFCPVCGAHCFREPDL